MKDLTADINYPSCKRKVRQMVPGRSKRLSCGCTLQFSGDDGRKVQHALDDLERQLQQLRF